MRFDFRKIHKYCVTQCPHGADGLVLGRIFQSVGRSVIAVMPDDFAMDQMRASMGYFYPHLTPYYFPSWDCLPYDRVSPSRDVMAERMRILCDLQSATGAVLVITTAAAAMQKIISPSELQGRQVKIEIGGRCDVNALIQFLNANGYGRVGTVREVGEYAMRGGLIDIFPSESQKPYRIDLFGDVIEKIHCFDPVTQRREEWDGTPVAFYPVQEIFMDDSSIHRFRANYRENFGAESMNDAIYESISAGHRYAGMEHWLSYFYGGLSHLWDYVPDAVLLAAHGLDLAMQSRADEIADYYASRLQFIGTTKQSKDSGAYRPVPPDLMYCAPKDIQKLFSDRPAIVLQSSAGNGDLGDMPIGGRPAHRIADARAYGQLGQTHKLFDEFKQFLSECRKDRRDVLLACYSAGSMDRIKKLLAEFGIDSIFAPDFANLPQTLSGRVGLTVLPIESGFVLDDLAVVSEQDLLGDRLSRAVKRERKAENVLFEASSLHAGDFVVHADHGVGRFLNLQTIPVANADHDCLCIEYAGGDKLYVPVENIELLSRYGDHDAIVALDKLGGAAWQARKARVKQRLMEMAEQLIRIAAERAVRPGEVLPKPENYDQFCARFRYAETEDQLRAIEDASRDLASGKPMDRLVCGDVGFGKTEVALRAAFIAASHGVQVAVVTPTTLLARQHYANFTRRFDGFPIRVAQLSRFVTAKDAAQIRTDLADGKINVVIGTHAILAKSIKFANLGLLIVDEEQHFGVEQKERLKDFQANVHVLTLTATPIPRTLQMALTGVRDLSIIATPPVDRHAVQTHVMPYDAMIVREAILRERHRGGQSFYVCPRIEDLDGVAGSVRALIPDLRVAVAHGQMAASSLEEIMQDFIDLKYDLLISTNIIESGLDIPSANTIIIHRADMFGLAQLYQLRGRVGRSKVRAYAYLTIPERRVPTETAKKRLEVMQTLDHLGAGFTVASHDMDIRGAGNLLGEEQSGHVREVGIELYQNLLQEAVANARSGTKEAPDSKPGAHFIPQINLGIPVLIPDDYIVDLSTRLSFYRRISTLKSDEEIQSVAAEMVDRFGILPQEVENLLTVVSIKNMCLAAGIEKIDAGPKGAVIALYQNKFRHPEQLVQYINQQRGTIKIRPDQKLVLMRGWGDDQSKIRGIREFMTDIQKIAA